MTFPCACQACGCTNQVEWSQAGQKIACRGCGHPMLVAPREASGPAVATEAMVKFRCPACQRKFAIKAELAGKKIRCSGCGAGVRVPLTDGVAAASEASLPSVKAFAGVDGAVPPTRPSAALDPSPFLEELASIEGVKPPRNAGTLLTSRSELMEQVRQQVTEETVVKEQKKAAKARKKKKKRKKGDGYFDLKETLKLVAGVGAFVAVLTLTAWYYPDFRFPVGGILVLVGAITYWLGIASLRQLVAEEGQLKALMFRFCPPYQWWFVATRWDEARDFVAFFGAGIMILSLGSAVIKTSPIGKKAMAADAALQKKDREAQARVGAPPVGGPAVVTPPPASDDDEE